MSPSPGQAAALVAARSALEEARSRVIGIDRDARAEVLDQLETRRRERHVTVPYANDSDGMPEGLLSAGSANFHGSRLISQI